ncbi:MAG TPA: c-type cytochrome biogenesis protein CcmI [Rhodospirillales bacterium]|nr:c-type cytochrome biogenesis protein CcmI [Rhodospirillales bacterium]HIL75620.1 c-type cytochrome biogenesis protein CcmI [Rhodospirillales bacterium]
MSFWIASGFVLLATLIAIILSIIRARANSSDEYNATIYHDQLNEVKRDIDHGVLSAEDGEALKTEIKKRLEKNTKIVLANAKDQSKQAGARSPITVAIAIVGIIPFTSYGLYSYLGSPGKPDLPFANRQFNPSFDAASAKMDSLVKKLRERLDQNPNQLKGWILLGQSLVNLKRFNAASNAFKQALKIAPNRAEIAASAAETRFMAKDGKFDQEVRDYFKMAQRLNPEEHKALYYLGLDSFMAKKYASAIQYWVDLISISPAGAPWMDNVRGRLIDAAEASNLKISNFIPRLKSASKSSKKLRQSREPAPTQEDINNANEMSKKEREKFIRSMVERLANSLKSAPNDLNGWRRLARSYRVLGEQKKAAEAEQRAIELEK